MIHKGPERVVELIERVYWRCKVPEHRHRSPQTAVACIKKSKAAELQRPRIRWTPEVYEALLRDVEAGETFADIGTKMGTTGEHLRDRLWQAIANRFPYAGPERPPRIWRQQHQEWRKEIDAKRAQLLSAVIRKKLKNK